MALDNDLVVDLLTYIEQVEKLKIKPAFSVPTEHFSAFQHELKGLPELRFNIQSEGEDVWLSVPRLREIPPPEPDQRLASWITVHKTPAKNPELNPSIESPSVPETPEQAEERTDIRELFDCMSRNFGCLGQSPNCNVGKRFIATISFLPCTRSLQTRVPILL
jgi:hypothetical protein